MLDLFIFLLVSVPLINFLHEMGHVIVARLVGMKVGVIEIGAGPRIFHFQCAGITININCIYLIGAHSSNEYEGELKQWARGLISLGGPLVNISVACIVILIGLSDSMSWQLFFLFNLWVGLINLIPFQIKGRQSDGFIFVQTMYRELRVILKGNK